MCIVFSQFNVIFIPAILYIFLNFLDVCKLNSCIPSVPDDFELKLYCIDLQLYNCFLKQNYLYNLFPIVGYFVFLWNCIVKSSFSFYCFKNSILNMHYDGENLFLI